jgi:hypothetical protein
MLSSIKNLMRSKAYTQSSNEDHKNVSGLISRYFRSSYPTTEYDVTKRVISYEPKKDKYLEDEVVLESLYQKLKEREGSGFTKKNFKGTNIDQDTNTGITRGFYAGVLKNNPNLKKEMPEKIEDLNSEQIKKIYKYGIYKPYRLGEIKNEKTKEALFDTLINHSPTDPIRWIQEGVNKNSQEKVKEDGIIGKETINSLNKLTKEQEQDVVKYFFKKRIEDIDKKIKSGNSEMIKWEKGLKNRINKLSNN